MGFSHFYELTALTHSSPSALWALSIRLNASTVVNLSTLALLARNP